MTTPSISVALCTHNGAAYVREQVESILTQTYPVAQIVLSDDASSDDTVAIVEQAVAAASPAPQLVVLRNRPALGVSANFQQAVSACTGDLIALCDQDDVWHADKLARFVELFDGHPDLPLAHSDAALVTATRAPLPTSLLDSLEITAGERAELVDGRSYRALLRRNLVTGATTVFRRSLLGPAIPFAPSWVHDEWLAIVAAALSRTLLIGDQLIDYRQHGGNQIGARKPTLADKFARLREPRQARNLHLVARASELVDRLEAMGSQIDPERMEYACAKLAHERWRLALPAAHVLRVPRIIWAVVRGRYARFSRGVMDAGRDLVQSAG